MRFVLTISNLCAVSDAEKFCYGSREILRRIGISWIEALVNDTNDFISKIHSLNDTILGFFLLERDPLLPDLIRAIEECRKTSLIYLFQETPRIFVSSPKILRWKLFNKMKEFPIIFQAKTCNISSYCKNSEFFLEVAELLDLERKKLGTCVASARKLNPPYVFYCLFGFELPLVVADFLSGSAQLTLAKRTHNSRLLCQGSLLMKYKLNVQPLVDELSRIVHASLVTQLGHLKIPLLTKAIWPPNKIACVCLTHDVDKLTPHWSQLLKRTKLYTAKRRLAEIIPSILSSLLIGLSRAQHRIRSRAKNGFDALKFFPYSLLRKFQDILYVGGFEKYMDVEKKNGASSTFFILINKSDMDSNYDINSPALALILRDIIQRGWEVSLHASYFSLDLEQILQEEKKLLEAVIKERVAGVRQHYFRFNPPNTWIAQSNAGFTYDTTPYFPDEVGFYFSTCLPFFAYDYVNNRELDLVEIPLSINDTTLFHYMKLNIEEAFHRCKELIDTIYDHMGVLVINWHMRASHNDDFPRWFYLYEKILEYACRSNVWVPTCREVAQWWKIRDKTKVREFIFGDGVLKATIDLPDMCEEIAFELVIPSGMKVRRAYLLHRDLVKEISVSKVGEIHAEFGVFQKYSLSLHRPQVGVSELVVKIER